MVKIIKARANKTVTSGITASTSQSQGNGALTSDVNEVDTVGSDGDTVTLPPALAGREVTIINNGANTLQIFPASGDDLGSGLNVSQELEPNEAVEFIGFDDTNWHIEATTEIIHAEMFDTNNADAYVINGQTDDHMYHTNGMVAGELAGWTFDAGGAGTSIAIASIGNGGGGKIDVTTSTNHGLATNDIVSITNTGDSNYDTTFIVTAIGSDTVFEVTATFGSTATGTMDQAAVLIAGGDAAGDYLVTWHASGTSATNNETFDFAIHVGATHQASTNTRRKFGTAGDVGSFSGVSIIKVANADRISFMISNIDSAANITLRNFTLVLVRL